MQANVEREAGVELLNDLPWSKASLVRVGTSQVEVELVEGSLGQEVGPAGESFQVKELVFDEAVNGFHGALGGVSGGGKAHLARAEIGDGGEEVGSASRRAATRR